MTYEEVKTIRKNPTNSDVDNKELSKMIDEAIEKQIPKRQKEQMKYCGKCDCGKFIFQDEKYCSNCGQALDWSE